MPQIVNLVLFKYEVQKELDHNFFPKVANVFHVFEQFLDNAFLHLRDCAPCTFILLSSSKDFSLKSLYRRELRAVPRNSPTRVRWNIDLGRLLSM